jgi:hypothetical protein
MTEAERAVLDNVLDESTEGEGFEQQAQMNAMAQLQNGPIEGQLPVLPGMEAPPIAQMPLSMGGMLPPALPNIITPGQQQASLNESGEGLVKGAGVPGGPPVITVRTDMEAMMSDGIIPFGQGRQPRRNPFRGGGMEMGPMMPSVPRYNPMNGGNGMVPPSSTSSSGNQQITITKLE